MLTLLGLTSIALGSYWLSLRLWPIAACSRCDGSGKIRSPNGRSWRPCKRCSGSGGRTRIGRRILDGARRSARNL